MWMGKLTTLPHYPLGRVVSAAILGGMGFLVYAPFHLWPFLFVSVSGFAYLLFQEVYWKNAFQTIFAFFFFSYFSILHWVGNAFSVVELGALSFVGYVLLPLVHSIIPGFASFIAWKLTASQPNSSRSPSNHVRQALALGALWNAGCLMHMLGELGFPWVLPGYALPLEFQQIASIIGIEGLSFIVLFASLALFARSVFYRLLTLCIMVGIGVFGFLRLKNDTYVTAYNLRLIQPSISQDSKWDPERTQHHLQIQGLLSQMEAEKPVQAIIWPEAAVTFDFSKYPELQKMLANAAPQGGYVFLGTVRDTPEGPHNSLVILNDKGEKLAVYDKKHLVPFGEYIPLRSFFPGIQKMTHGVHDFVPGVEPDLIVLETILPFRPLICYEAIFSREILAPFGHSILKKTSSLGDIRPQWLLNLTNDGWYGDSFGPHQHLYNVKVRAIEQGLPLVRVANNGISAVIDPYGRMLHRLELNDVGIIDFSLPQALLPTFYSVYGFWVLPILFALSGIIFVSALLLQRHKVKKSLL